jgi:quercetin dioxygenase-like cupin family protein
MQSYRLRRADLAWQPLDGAAGVEIAALKTKPCGASQYMVRMAMGAEAPLHRLPGGEDLVVLEGTLAIEGEVLQAGDYRSAPPGAVHASRALTDTILFLSLPKGIEFVAAR